MLSPARDTFQGYRERWHICYKFENPETDYVWASFQCGHSVIPAKPERNYLTLNHPFKARCTASNPTESSAHGPSGQMRISRWREWCVLVTIPEASITRLFQILLWWGASPTYIFPLHFLVMLVRTSLIPRWQNLLNSAVYFLDHEIILWKAKENYILSSVRNLTKHPYNPRYSLFL